MFEHDRSAARGEMNTRKLVVFKHESPYGNAPAHKLFEMVKVSRRDTAKPARAYSDYDVTFDKSGLPSGITVQEML
jgi:CRISPR-associated protein Csd2